MNIEGLKAFDLTFKKNTCTKLSAQEVTPASTHVRLEKQGRGLLKVETRVAVELEREA